MRPTPLPLYRALLVVLGIALGAAALEVLARWLLPDRFFVYPPGYRTTFDPHPEVIRGVTGPSRFSINPLGMRAGPFTPQQRVRLLAVGGSTTICIYLDDEEAWPHLVEEQLDAALGAGHAWVGNVGASGHTTVQHAIQVEKLLRQHPEIDVVLLLIGANDLLIQLTLAQDGAAVAKMLATNGPAALLESAFSVFPGPEPDASWYWRTGLGRLWLTRRRILPAFGGDDAPVLDPRGFHVDRWRAYRKQASRLRNALPDLGAALDQYARNVNRIIDAAAAEGVRPIFLTQPALWREDLSSAERDLLWAGGPGFDRLAPGRVYYSVAALAEGMRRYNERLLEVCRQRGAECFDLAARLPRDATVFWDDAHFTEEGARRVAELVAGYLLERPSRLARRSGRDRALARGQRPAAPDLP